jgi:peptidoglycan/LPS O-acetylase OafA/YrhL
LIISVIARLLFGNYHLLPTRPLVWFPLCRIFEFGFGIYLANIIREERWKVLNDSLRFQSIIVFCSTISYPLFLVHRNILDIAKHSPHYGFPPILWVPLFLASSIFISWFFLQIDHKFKQRSVP